MNPLLISAQAPKRPPERAAPQYHPLSMALHALMAVGLVAMVGLGLFMTGLSFSPQRLQLYNWHKWLGVALLALWGLRLLWRWRHPAPALPLAVQAAMPTWQHRAHRWTHVALYGLMGAVPLLGWAYSSAAGFPVVWWGVWPLPDWVPRDPEWAATLKLLHRLAAYALAALMALHVAAALKHHWVDRDGLLERMWPFGRWGRSAAFAVAAGMAVALLLALPVSARAQQALVPGQSRLAFVIQQMGVPVEGQFRRFDAQLAFDPARPDTSRLGLTVDVTSATLGSPEIDAELPKAIWFNAARHGQAVFQSTQVKALGPGRFEVTGTLTLKGISRTVVVPVVLSQAGAGAQLVTTATGSFTLPRLAFRLGEQEWADTSLLADAVQVRFSLVLKGIQKL